MKQKHRLPFPGFFCDSLELMTRDVNTAICSFSDQLGFYTTFSRMLQRTGIWAWILSGFFFSRFFQDSFKILSRFFQDSFRILSGFFQHSLASSFGIFQHRFRIVSGSFQDRFRVFPKILSGFFQHSLGSSFGIFQHPFRIVSGSFQGFP